MFHTQIIRSAGSSLTVLALATATLVGASGCKSENTPLAVLGTLFLDQQCRCQPPQGGATVPFRNLGRMDIGIVDTYTTCIALQNRLFNPEAFVADTSTTKQLIVNTRDIVLDRAEVTIEGAYEGALQIEVPTYQVILDGTRVPARNQLATNIQLARAITFNLVPTQVADTLRLDPELAAGNDIEVIVYVTFIGHTQSGGEVRGEPYQFPLTLCVGCLSEFPGRSLTQCPSGSVLVQGGSTGISCRPGNDESTVQCQCPTGFSVVNDGTTNGTCVPDDQIQANQAAGQGT
jgi:hypothetical protein